jgi:hypothetical protein
MLSDNILSVVTVSVTLLNVAFSQNVINANTDKTNSLAHQGLNLHSGTF